MTAVVDASVLTAFYATPEVTTAVRDRLAQHEAYHAPAHLDVEVLSALRRIAKTSRAVESAMPRALTHLAAFPLRRMPLAPLLLRIWELRDTITAYDAAYVALAERLDAPLITFDKRLTGASGARCRFELLE